MSTHLDSGFARPISYCYVRGVSKITKLINSTQEQEYVKMSCSTPITTCLSRAAEKRKNDVFNIQKNFSAFVILRGTFWGECTEDRTGLWAWGVGARAGRETDGEVSALQLGRAPWPQRDLWKWSQKRGGGHPASSWNFPKASAGWLGEAPSWPGTQDPAWGVIATPEEEGSRRARPQLPPGGAQDAGGGFLGLRRSSSVGTGGDLRLAGE